MPRRAPGGAPVGAEFGAGLARVGRLEYFAAAADVRVVARWLRAVARPGR